MITKDTSIGVIGMGLLGGSYLKGFKKAGYCRLTGVDRDEKAVAYALESGLAEKASSDPSVIADCDIVISALYPHVFVKWIEENQKYLKAGCLLTDVTGVKRSVIDEISRILRRDVEFIACHPMAGREYKGIRFADETRFENANYIIVPTGKNTEEALQTASEIAGILKFGNIAVLSPEEHDRMIGFVSQLTHVIAVSLMNMSDNSSLAEYTGDSFRDLTRIARINEDLWPELFVLNKDYLVEQIDGFVREMMQFRDMIENEDLEGMKQKLILSTERRKAFD